MEDGTGVGTAHRIRAEMRWDEMRGGMIRWDWSTTGRLEGMGLRWDVLA